ncbi:NUDIX hydrolase [Brevibacterium album]|uniref:NUDIX hydrolase n=1 Tax=Brevibacterium album TaxID=417948 RepID=UPI0004000781|nr:CoA pyrophosphatase [Brevibacterium album]
MTIPETEGATPEAGLGDPVRAALAGLLEAATPREWMRRSQAPAGMNVRAASVLMLFGRGTAPRTAAGAAELDRLAELGAAEVDVLLLERAATLRQHAGQPAFPGGGADADDESPVHTALREAQEETGLNPEGVDVLGTLDALYVPASRYEVTPVLGWWVSPTPVQAVDLGESSLVERVAVADLVAPANRGVYAPTDRPWTTPVFDVGVMRPWGFTAGLLDWALGSLGWDREWDRDRYIHIDW